MSEFDLVGYDRKEHFEKHLEPYRLGEELERYQEVFETDFGIKELLELEKIKALALVAEAINDAPEFLAHQLGKGGFYKNIRYVSDALDRIADEM